MPTSDFLRILCLLFTVAGFCVEMVKHAYINIAAFDVGSENRVTPSHSYLVLFLNDFLQGREVGKHIVFVMCIMIF